MFFCIALVCVRVLMSGCVVLFVCVSREMGRRLGFAYWVEVINLWYARVRVHVRMPAYVYVCVCGCVRVLHALK